MLRVYTREKYGSLPEGVFDTSENLSVFLYGRTGSGKTYTLQEIIASRLDQESLACVQISEVYRGTHTTLVPDTVLPGDRVLPLLEKHRKTKKTAKNDRSSRSIMCLKIKSSDREIVLIDLMGSEKAEDKEGKLNNANLLSLYRCMLALKDKASHVPYNDCTLTKILRDCVSNSQVCFIGCIDPTDVAETKRTCDFLSIAKAIRLKVPKQKEDNIREILNSLEKLDDLIK